MGMKLVEVCCLIGCLLHEWFVFNYIFIFVPFGVGCKESTFIGAFANIRGTELGFKRKSDRNWPVLPQATQGRLVSKVEPAKIAWM